MDRSGSVLQSSSVQRSTAADDTPYDSAFYSGMREESSRSARAVVPLIMQWLRPRSVLDVGCGVGTWLAAFRDAGVQDVLGLDGDYVDRSQLRIPEANFQPADLTAPPALLRRYDLAVCLEVAEHLPRDRAEGLVRLLCGSAPAVLFSAAMPGQGGTHHVNEQWPWFWTELFAARSYVRIDALRPLLWGNSSVEWYYRQNLVLFADSACLAQWPELAARHAEGAWPFELVSEHVLRAATRLSFRQLLAQLPAAIKSSVLRRAGRLA